MNFTDLSDFQIQSTDLPNVQKLTLKESSINYQYATSSLLRNGSKIKLIRLHNSKYNHYCGYIGWVHKTHINMKCICDKDPNCKICHGVYYLYDAVQIILDAPNYKTCICVPYQHLQLMVTNYIERIQSVELYQKK